MEGIALDSVSKVYLDHAGKPFRALNEVSVRCERGHSIALVGESGSGKSTLARLMLRIERPDKGAVYLDGIDMASVRPKRLRTLRKDIQGVFQDARGTFNLKRTAYQNVEEALINLSSLTKQQRKQRIGKLMQATGLHMSLLDTPVAHLSGGEQRRLSLIRALSLYPRYVILDEVTSGLDLISAHAVVDLLQKCQQMYGCTYVLITHEIDYAYRLCDQVFEMNNGCIVRKAEKFESRLD